MRRYSSFFLYSMLVMHSLSSTPTAAFDLLFSHMMLEASANEARQDPMRINYFASILRSLTSMLCGSLFLLNRKEQLQAFVVHFLATGPKTFSQIQGETPDVLKDDAHLDLILEQVADCGIPEDCMGSSTYRLKSQCLGNVNIFYPGLVEDELAEAMEYLAKTHGFNAVQQAISQRYASAVYFQPLFQHSQILDGIIRLILEMENPRSFLMDLLGLLSFAHQSNPQFLINNRDLEERLIAVVLEEMDTDMATKTLVRELCSQVLGHFKEMTFQLSVLPARPSSPKASAQEARKQAILARMQASQRLFSESNPDATVVVDEQMEATETCEMAESGVCVLCQEPADFGSAPYGTFARDDLIRFGLAESEHVFVTCFHLIHQHCYARIVQVPSGRFRKCPLCRFPARKFEGIGRALPLPPADQPTDRLFSLFKQYPLTHPAQFPLLPIGNLSNGARLRTTSFSDRQTAATQARPVYRALCRQYLALHRLDARPQMTVVIRTLRLVLAKWYWTYDSNDASEPVKLDLENDPVTAWLTLLVNSVPPSLCDDKVEAVLAQALKLHLLWVVRDSNPTDLSGRVLDEFLLIFIVLHVWLGVALPDRNHILHLVFPEVGISADMDAETTVARLRAAALQFDMPVTKGTVHHSLILADLQCFVVLPADYLDLLREMNRRGRCQHCRVVPLTLLCLHCGLWFCAQLACPLTLTHSCVSSVALRLEVREGGVVVRHEGLATMMPAPYVDAHGEADLKLRRGNPLRLSPGRYRQLQILYLSGGFPALLYRRHMG